ncbi:hypothetical protein AMATHDRAFT_924 [Amanita thiersii Skay4041]|uniref:G-protein coupled receptors family 1 profile domain-containing protein n=1 Tax=Amanita thiersii Skay4041 TaxID=703135 RepID=A0A2A9NYU7_9AGAR|nr:hypothetical protein AMATHDRAFT_924 [Amanita thiersii Skay4041]
MAPPQPPPPGLNFIASIKSPLYNVIIAHTFTSFLLPLIIALFYFSTPRSRRQPTFVLNVVNICLAMTAGSLLDARAVRFILSPLNPPPLSWNITIGCLGAVQTILVDIILLLRLVAVYPRSYIGGRRFVLLITLPILLKGMRIANLIAFIKALTDATRDPATANSRIASVWAHSPYLKIEWVSQMVENTYASGFFLWRLHLKNWEHRNVTTGSSSASFTERLRVLFSIALGNFIFPMLFSVVQLIVVFREVHVSIINVIVLVNTSIAVIGVVFATVWAESSNWVQDQKDNWKKQVAPAGQAVSELVFQRNVADSSGLTTTETSHQTVTGHSDSPIEFKTALGSQPSESSIERKLEEN